MFAGDTEQLATGDQHAQPCATTQQLGQIRAGCNNVFKIVENQQQLSV
jgi:hypothetical protein